MSSTPKEIGHLNEHHSSPYLQGTTSGCFRWSFQCGYRLYRFLHHRDLVHIDRLLLTYRDTDLRLANVDVDQAERAL
ncbi:hypothetical protein PHET_05885 [Paragonimus heterotremus]|uniref:Uncharacterized protein n=1 Tax=Paragonimus heterotremus TaxID=100268 RepID=A0A8J4SXS1_9TREM|nr:hypothetical protein PHET_05885 [Paragonimus heterotremus]